MSTTMLSSSSSGRKNVASTTKVAPCSCWAGPKTSPRKLWATITWSRTVTRNTWVLPLCGWAVCIRSRPVGSGGWVDDAVAQRRQLAAGEPGHYRGQLLDRALAGDERVEGRVSQQPGGQADAVGEPAAGPPRGRDRPHLAAADGQPARVEPLAEGHVDHTVAVPAEFDHLALVTQQLQRPGQPGRAAAGVHHEVAAAVGGVGCAEGHAERGGDVGPGGGGVDQLH